MAWWERHGPSALPSCDVKVGRQNWHHGLASDLSTHAMTPLNPCTTLIKESKPKIRMVSSPVKLLFLMQKILYHIKRFSKNSKHWRSRRTLSLGFPCKHNFSDGTWFKKKMYPPSPHHGRLTYTNNKQHRRRSQCTALGPPSRPRHSSPSRDPRNCVKEQLLASDSLESKLSAMGIVSGFSLVLRQEGAVKPCPHLRFR